MSLDHSIDPNSFSKYQLNPPPYIITSSHLLKHQPNQESGERERVYMETLCPSSVVSNSSLSLSWRWSTSWTKEENKMFESGLAMIDEESPDRWSKVAAMIPGKTVHDVMNQYMELVADVRDIEAGLVPIPAAGYLSSTFTFDFDVCRKKTAYPHHVRKKGVPWTQDEHRRFLLGLEKHGKGDWKNISRNFVVSKTPTQVASHAQKYYLRQLSGVKDKRRPSIHDLTIHLSGASPPDATTTPCFLEKSEEAAGVLLNWNDIAGDGDLMIFDSSGYGSSFVAY